MTSSVHEDISVHTLCAGADACFGTQTSALGVVYPSLLLIYLGQAAYLTQNPGSYSSLYYSSIPTPVYWPMFIIALLASIVASQSIITGDTLSCGLPSVMLRSDVDVLGNK